jgi:hypothetical protein
MDFNSVINNIKSEVVKGETAMAEGFAEAEHKITDAGHRKIKEMLDELNSDLPIFEKAGYKLHSLEVEVGISPKLIPHFRVCEHITEEEQKAILEEVRHKRILHALLSSLFKSSYLKKVLRVGNLDFHGLRIELSAVPTVRLQFVDLADPIEDDDDD